MHRSRPRVAVTGKASRWAPGWWCSWLAIALAGGKAIRATPDTGLPPAYEALVIGGGDDIASDLYAASPAFEHDADRRRDAFELAAIRQAEASGQPILGICRGAQLINVAAAGTLYTDIAPLRRRTSNRVNPLACKPVALKRHTRLSRLVSARKLRVNSLHHQAVRLLGHGMTVCARDADGFVQAIESTRDRFVLGLQWHPEYMLYARAQRSVFSSLVRAARAYRATAGRDPREPCGQPGKLD